MKRNALTSLAALSLALSGCTSGVNNSVIHVVTIEFEDSTTLRTFVGNSFEEAISKAEKESTRGGCKHSMRNAEEHWAQTKGGEIAWPPP